MIIQNRFTILRLNYSYEKKIIPKIDYYKIVKESDFDGYIGIEYEGEKLSEHEGILATKALLEKVWEELG